MATQTIATHTVQREAGLHANMNCLVKDETHISHATPACIYTHSLEHTIEILEWTCILTHQAVKHTHTRMHTPV